MRALLAGVLMAGLACELGAGDLPAKSEDVSTRDTRKLLQVTGAGQMTLQVMSTLIASIKEQWPNVPEHVWAEVLGEFKGDDIVELMIPVYQKHFTHEDVRGLLAFYESPTGRKLLEVQSQLMQESMVVGRQWGEQCFDRAWKRLRARGYAPKPTAESEGPSRRGTTR
jgi:uncharacterized protein